MAYTNPIVAGMCFTLATRMRERIGHSILRHDDGVGLWVTAGSPPAAIVQPAVKPLGTPH
jgi:hypothetical protein